MLGRQGGSSLTACSVASRRALAPASRPPTGAGLHAYFAHKAEEYSVYFLDLHCYEDTKPFYVSLLHS